MSALLEKWIAYLQAERGLSLNSVTAYRYSLETFAEYLDRRRPSRQLRHARREDVRGFLGEILVAGTPGAARSACQRLTALRSFYKLLQIDGVMRKNPAMLVEFPKTWKTLPRFLNTSEVLRLLDGDSLTVRNRAILELLYGSGVRVSELVSARVSDLHLEGRVLRVHGKGDKERDVPLNGPTVRLLREYLAVRRSGSAYIFTSEANGRPSDRLSRVSVWRLVREHAQVAGLGEVHPHTLRHSCATALLEGGADLRTIQTILGHEDINTTQIYSHVSTKHLRSEYEKLERRRARGQMPLRFQPSSGVVICAQCPSLALDGKTLCEVHLILQRARAKRCYQRKARKSRETLDTSIRLGVEAERARPVRKMRASALALKSKPVQSVS